MQGRIAEALVLTRLTLIAITFHIGSLLARNAIAMMPDDHPGKTYARSRIAEGHERLAKALCPKAAVRLIQDRRLVAKRY